MTIKEKINLDFPYLIVLFLGFFFGCAAMTTFKEYTSVYSAGREVGYKEGQIDYANGRIAFELKKQNDGTTQWAKKESPEKTKQ